MALKVGRPISHSSKVLINGAEETQENSDAFRYLLTFSYLRPAGPTITVVLMNPSGADKAVADVTIRRVEDCLPSYFPDVREVKIINLLGIRGKLPEDVNAHYEKGLEVNGSKNDFWLEEAIRTSHKIVYAWGGPGALNVSLYSERVALVQSLVQKYKKEAYRICGGKFSEDSPFPLHGRLWGYNFRSVKVA